MLQCSKLLKTPTQKQIHNELNLRLNPVILDGYGVRIRVQGSVLELTNGKLDQRLPVSMRFRPRRCLFDSIVLDAFSGYVSLRALHWLGKNQIPLFMLDYDGTLLSSTLPKQPIRSDVRQAQYQAVNDPKKKFAIAHALIKAKIVRSLQVLDWLGERYDIGKELRITKREAVLSSVSSVNQIRTVDKTRLQNKIGGLSKAKILEVKGGRALNLGTQNPRR